MAKVRVTKEQCRHAYDLTQELGGDIEALLGLVESELPGGLVLRYRERLRVLLGFLAELEGQLSKERSVRRRKRPKGPEVRRQERARWVRETRDGTENQENRGE